MQFGYCTVGSTVRCNSRAYVSGRGKIVAEYGISAFSVCLTDKSAYINICCYNGNIGFIGFYILCQLIEIFRSADNRTGLFSVSCRCFREEIIIQQEVILIKLAGKYISVNLIGHTAFISDFRCFCCGYIAVFVCITGHIHPLCVITFGSNSGKRPIHADKRILKNIFSVFICSVCCSS